MIRAPSYPSLEGVIRMSKIEEIEKEVQGLKPDEPEHIHIEIDNNPA